MSIQSCPKCGSIEAVYRNVRASGWCQEYFNQEGYQDEIETSNLHFSESKKFYCGFCGCVRNDITMDEQARIINKTSEAQNEKE